MPIKSRNPMEEAQSFYQRMVSELIVDIPVGEDLYQPQLNFTGLADLVRDDPQSAQLVTQWLAQEVDGEDGEQARQHGVWLMMALLVVFGPDSPVVKTTRFIAMDFYEAAVAQFDEL